MRNLLCFSAAAALLGLTAPWHTHDIGTIRAAMVACSGSVSGAIRGTYTCTPVTAIWSSSDNIGALTINVTGSPTLTIGIGFTGTPAARTYVNTDAGATSGVSITSGKAIWLAGVGNRLDQGSYSLKLTSVGAAVPMGNGKGYAVHGTLTATLLPLAGSTAAGTATVSITF